MAFDLPRDEILPVKAIDVVLDPAPHPFEIEHADAIEANWQIEHAANPALFDGRMVLLSELRYEAQKLSGRCHEVRFATMLHWRKNRVAANVEHCFAHAALVSKDNALVAIRMGKHTANAGKIYFAAGSFERQDFVDGRADPVGNMRRELREETGLDLDTFLSEAGYHFLSRNRMTVMVRRYWMDENADDIADRIRDHVLADPDPEIDGPVVIRSADDLPAGVLPHMEAIIAWHFGQTGPR